MIKQLIYIVLVLSNTYAFCQSGINTVKGRVVRNLMSQKISEDQVEELLKTIGIEGKWPGINYTDVSRTGFEHRIHLANMVILARAYQTSNSKFYKDAKVKDVIESALRNWVDNDYFCDNWWHNQIGTPNGLVTLMLLVGDELPEDLVIKAQPIIGRATVDAPGARPGGDRIKIAGIQAKNLLFLNDSEGFGKIVKVIEGEIKYVDWIGNMYGYGFRQDVGGFQNRSAGGRGIQYDNSFHHRIDGVNNTLSYGLGYADAFVEWAVYTANTEYSFSTEKLNLLIDYYLDGICKTSIFGKFPDPGAKNRSISRIGTLHAYSASTAEKLLMTSDYREDELQEIIDIRNSDIKPTLSHATYYWQSEHFTFQRPEFFTSVRMYSTRVHNMEWPYNSEGFLNHHRGDGTNHISRTGDEYYDMAPVYDYQKIPGTTVMQKTELPTENEVRKLGLTDFVGAVTDGKYGAVGFDFKSPHDPLCARKAWFFFDQEYVSLGAGISCEEELPVVTTINQCLLKGDVIISENHQKSKIGKGEKEFINVDWVFHDKIGYIFPQPVNVSIKNNESTGSWWRVNKQTDSPKSEVKMDVFKLWLDHGKRPSDANYEYIVVPSTSEKSLEENKSEKSIMILANTSEIQAVVNKSLEIYQMVFYKAGDIQLEPDIQLSCHNPGIIMLKKHKGKVLEISASDPNRELSKLLLSISARIVGKGENFTATWNKTTKTSDIVVDLPQGQFAGSSVTIHLK